jgi:hypothetical protein
MIIEPDQGAPMQRRYRGVIPRMKAARNLATVVNTVMMMLFVTGG